MPSDATGYWTRQQMQHQQMRSRQLLLPMAQLPMAPPHQPAASAEAKHSLQRLGLPEDLPGFQEMQFRPDTAELIGLTADGSILVVDVVQHKVSTLSSTRWHAVVLQHAFKRL